MSRKSKKNSDLTKIDDQRSLLDILVEEHQQGGGVITSMLRMRSPKNLWSGLIATPPGSLLESVVAEFDKKTDIPLALPFFTTFHYIAAYLLHNNITLKYMNQDIMPDIWTVLLAPSGSGKSFTESTIRKSIKSFPEVYYDLSGVQSNAKYLEDLIINNRKLHVRDEHNELYKQIIASSGPMSLLRDTILRLYSNAKLEYRTKKESFEIDNPAICYLGMTVYDCFVNSITVDDLLNGFAQRFGYIIARYDEKKKITDYPHYDIETSKWEDMWDTLVESIKHKQYIANEDAQEAFETSFKLLYSGELDKSFYRRQAYRSHKYALIYHILTGNGHMEEVSASAYGWAARVTHMMITDCCELLNKHGVSELETKLRTIERFMVAFRERGAIFKARDAVQRIRSIKSTNEAKMLLDFVVNDDRCTTLDITPK